MYGLDQMTPQAIQDLKFKLFITKGLVEVIGYIHYHKCKVDHAVQLTFSAYTWLYLPHDTYATSLAPLVNSGLRFPKAVSTMASASPTTTTHDSHVATYTQTLIDYSAVDPKK